MSFFFLLSCNTDVLHGWPLEQTCFSFCVDMIPEPSRRRSPISGGLLEKCPFHTASHAHRFTASTRMCSSIIVQTPPETRPSLSRVLTSDSLLTDGIISVSEVAAHSFRAVSLGGLCVSDAASIIFHGVAIKHSREGLINIHEGEEGAEETRWGWGWGWAPGKPPGCSDW